MRRVGKYNVQERRKWKREEGLSVVEENMIKKWRKREKRGRKGKRMERIGRKLKNMKRGEWREREG